MLVKCVNDGRIDLRIDKLYRVIPDTIAAKCGCIRIVDDSGEDYLYPASWFTESSEQEKEPA